MDLFQLGDFVLNSGAKSSWKIEADALTDGDIAALAEMVRKLVRPFGRVEGIPRGGLRLAEALRPNCSTEAKSLLLVDDVLTTGGSMARAFQEHCSNGYEPWQIDGAVIFARGKCPSWIRPVFQLPIELWLPTK